MTQWGMNLKKYLLHVGIAPCLRLGWTLNWINPSNALFPLLLCGGADAQGCTRLASVFKRTSELAARCDWMDSAGHLRCCSPQPCGKFWITARLDWCRLHLQSVDAKRRTGRVCTWTAISCCLSCFNINHDNYIFLYCQVDKAVKLTQPPLTADCLQATIYTAAVSAERRRPVEWLARTSRTSSSLIHSTLSASCVRVKRRTC